MNDKYAKEIAKELNLIRRELQKNNKSQKIEIDGQELSSMVVGNIEKQKRAKEMFG